MSGRATRILGGVLLAATVAILAGNIPAVAAPNKGDKPTAKKIDSTKKATGTLATDAKLTAEQLARHIDKIINARLKEEKVDASTISTDEEFVRRVYLDLTGKIPTGEQATAFLDSKETNKRAKLIDELLASKDYGKFMADVWQAQLLPRDSANARVRQWYPQLTAWLEAQFNDNPGWDKTVKEFLTAKGDITKNGPVVYWVANNSSDKMTDNVTRLFMGIQLQCAQCHNHPFTDYKQTEYWHMAAFFAKVGPDGNPKGAAKKGTSVSVSENGKIRKKLANPDAKVLPPKFLQGEAPKVKPSDELRPLLAAWMATKENPWFSRAMVNRTWGHLFGRGIIAPVDDMHDGNPASHPELLIDLASQFANNSFDVKYLVRAICNSETYQRSSKMQGNNEEAGPELFARMLVKPLTPGQMYDSVALVVGRTDRQPAKGKNGRVAVGGREQFIASYGIDEASDPTEYQAGIPQVLRLMNAAQFNNAGLLTPVMKASKNQAEATEKLYLAVLARRPKPEEVERLNKFVEKNGYSRETMSSVLWVLMNSSEFALNR